MADTSQYQWSTKYGAVKFGGAVAGVRLDTAMLDAMIAEFKPAISAVLEEVGKETAQVISAAAPVDTGELRDSYLSESELMEELLYRIQDGAPVSGVAHGIYVELGTSRMAAQPHVVPAVEKAYPELIGKVEDLFK